LSGRACPDQTLHLLGVDERGIRLSAPRHSDRDCRASKVGRAGLSSGVSRKWFAGCGDPGGCIARRRRSRYRCCIGDDDNAARRRLGTAGGEDHFRDTPLDLLAVRPRPRSTAPARNRRALPRRDCRRAASRPSIRVFAPAAELRGSVHLARRGPRDSDSHSRSRGDE
jgi:hypothetical protein